MKYIPLLYLGLISLLAVILTAHDKNAARKHARRVKERTLLMVSLLGGSVAMLLAMFAVRHKTRRIKFMVGIPLIILTQAVILAFIFILPYDNTRDFDGKEYNYDLAASVELCHIPVLTQETEHTCYAAVMVIVKKHLGFDTTEKELLNELEIQDRATGMLPNEFASYANKTFAPIGYSVSLLNPKSQSEILNVITASLLDGLPVIFYYSTEDDWDKPNYNTHYSVVYGVDMVNESVKISNPYGYAVELHFADFFHSLVFENYISEPLTHLLARKVGYIKSNNIFTLSNALK